MFSMLVRNVRLWLCVALATMSSPARADWVYGPPYSYNVSFGSAGGFLSVDAAVNSLIADYERGCETYLTCKPHSFSVAYRDSNNYSAAVITINFVNPDGTVGSTLGGHIFASQAKGTGFQPKNVGGCRTMCTGGNGSPMDSLGPRGSSQEGMNKLASSNVGTPLEGDPINASNGNAYRQDTDLPSSHWLTFRRFYNSSPYVVATTMGPKWRHSFDRTINRMPNGGDDAGLIYARRPDGSMLRFRSSGGVWTPDTDAADTLSVTRDAATGEATGYLLRVAATSDNERYDLNGRLLSIIDDNGSATELVYSDATTGQAIAPSPGLLIAVIDVQGRQLHLGYDEVGRLSKVTDPAGQAATYAYAESGNLAKVTYADNSSRQYLYAEAAHVAAPNASPSALTGVIDEKGVRFETTSYDSKNRAFTSHYAGGADKISLSYYNYTENGGIPADMTTPLGLVVTLNFSDNGAQALAAGGASTQCGNQCNQPWKSASYDARGYPASFKDHRGTVTSTTYDANGLLIQLVEALGTSAQRTTSTTWNTQYRRPLTRETQDAAGNVVARGSWAHNPRGQVTAECAVDPSVSGAYACGSQAHAPQGIRQVRYTYCDALDLAQCPRIGLLLAIEGPRNDVKQLTRFAYYLTTDESDCVSVGGECHRAGDLARMTNAAGQTTTLLAYDHHGRPVR